MLPRPHAGDVNGGTPCRHWPRRHVPRVAWPGVPPTVEGPFRQKISQVVFCSISLAQVVSCVKNSVDMCYMRGVAEVTGGGVSHVVFCTVEIEIDGHCAEPTK
jgi:hypothetical protein